MRLQLAINVSNLDEAVDFYSKMFDCPPAKVRPGYANFAIENPPLKFVLFESTDGGGTLNHLGVEAESTAEVIAAEQRLIASGLETTGIDDTECCYAQKTETWLAAPDDVRWEWYVKTGDVELEAIVNSGAVVNSGGPACCG
ncbi:MAG: VOC family protein [Acidobacteria bacterium]|nr:VOC family protein [Acidobacteriota bacterium]